VTATAETPVTLPPALQHIATTGAAITDLGDYHGLRRVVARTGDQFMLLSATQDGQAVVAGLMSDLSAADLSQLAGGSLAELGMFHGLRGMVVKSGTQFQVFYATPDGQRVIPGVMWDAAGKNLTRDQVTSIAGAIPTVTIGPAAAAASQNTTAAVTATAQTAPALNIVQATNFGTIGSPSAPRLWMFIDPLCSFSVRAMQQLQPFVASGRVQVAVIPLAVIDHETNGRSTTNALAMLSKPADQMVTAWSRGDLGDAPAPEARAHLLANMTAAQAIGFEGTPTMIWRKADGSEGRSDGLPRDLNAVLASMGN
jgi:thiol:disulfide interchange protein DsbG